MPLDRAQLTKQNPSTLGFQFVLNIYDKAFHLTAIKQENSMLPEGKN